LAGQRATWAEEEGPPTIAAVFVEQPPVLDGNLDDPCWQQATKITDFYDTDQKKLAPEEFKTTAYLAYDSKNIYFAYHLLDPQPSLIHAFETKRGGSLTTDDHAEVWMDTMGGRAHSYTFKCNAIGTQYESFPRGSAPKIEWRGDWSCAAKTVADGWNCEMAIPFSILQYSKGVKEFRLALSRKVSRINKDYYWPNVGSSPHDYSLAAAWTGLELPPIKPRPLLMPYVEVDADQDTFRATQGLDAKYRPEPGVTAMLTLNPDFKNVEQQVEGIDFTYTQRFVGDSRPFFMEGNQPPSSVWWTRQIPVVDMGAKVYGTLGQMNFDAVHVRDFGARDDTELNWYQDFNEGFSEASALFVNRHEPGVVENTLVGAGISLGRRFARSGSQGMDVALYKSATAGPGGDGSRWRARLRHRPGPGQIGGGIDYWDTGAEYYPADGFLPAEERDLRGPEAWLEYSDRVDGRHLQSWQWEADYWDNRRHNGTLYERGTYGYVEASLQNNTSYGAGVSITDHPPYNDRMWAVDGGWNEDELYRGGNAEVAAGRLAGGNYLIGSLSQGFYLGGGASAYLSVDSSRHKFPDRVESASLIIAGFNQDLDVYRNISARLVSRGGNHNLYAAYRQAVRRGMDLYVIVGDPNADKTRGRLALKALWVY
jgi:hypothetical protein